MTRLDSMRSPTVWGILEGGALSGALAGAGMMLVLMIRSATLGEGFSYPLRLIGAVLLGADGVAEGAGTIITGTMVHFAFSAILGVIFAASRSWQRLGERRKPVGDRAFAAGALYAMLIWLVMTYFVLPWLNPVMAEQVSNMPATWLVVHLIFGGLLLSTPIFRERVAARHVPRGQALPQQDKAA